MFKKLTALVSSVVAIFASHNISFAETFDNYVMPITNPVYHGDSRNITMIRPIFMYHNVPDKVDTIIGKVPVGGEAKIYAVQATYAINERLSIVAVKDGYVDFEPNKTLSSTDGFADIAAGVQYSLLYDKKNDFILSGRLVFETTSGDEDVFQGNGSGNINPSLLFLKGYNGLQFSGALGFVIPFDTDEENTLFYDSWHVSYAVTPWFSPVVELNHFHVLSSGDRVVPKKGVAAIGTSQQDDLVAGLATFNCCDLVNLGGKYNDKNNDLVTMALGARFKVNNWLSLGLAYEFPLTDEEKSLFDNRFSCDAVFSIKF